MVGGVLDAACLADGSLLGFNVIGHQAMQLGDAHGGGFGSVQVNPVSTSRCPAVPGLSNPVASETESKVLTPPPTKAKPAPEVKAPDPDAIAIKSRFANKKPTPTYSEPNKLPRQGKTCPTRFTVRCRRQ